VLDQSCSGPQETPKLFVLWEKLTTRFPKHHPRLLKRFEAQGGVLTNLHLFLISTDPKKGSIAVSPKIVAKNP